jgi:hypothetical protein
MLTADFLELDVATVEVARFLGTGLVPAASLALVSRLKGDAPLITTEPDVFGASGYTITLVPLVQEFAGPDLLIPPEHVRVEPASGTPTPAYQIRERLDYVQRASVDTLEYSVFLPATVADLDPREIVVWANVINPGGNITAGVELLRAEYAFAGTETGRQQDSIRPVSESGGKAVFRGTGLSGVVATGSGRFGLVLRTSQKRPIENPTETERANRWRLGSLRVSVAGILPGSPTPRRL